MSGASADKTRLRCIGSYCHGSEKKNLWKLGSQAPNTPRNTKIQKPSTHFLNLRVGGQNIMGDAQESFPWQTVGGYDFYEVLSALQKSIRRCLEEDALFWASELYLSRLRSTGMAAAVHHRQRGYRGRAF